MTELENILIGAVGAMGTGLLFFIIKDVFWKKAQRNQERIDNAVIESVKESELKIVKIEKEILVMVNTVGNIVADVKELQMNQQTVSDTTKEVNSTLRILISNMDLQHKEIKGLVAENTKVMEKVFNVLDKR